jgi:two-component system, cell cycle response regulator DivK
MDTPGQVVLLIEDNAPNMRFFHDLLQAHGYHVVQAMTGDSGWRMAREVRPDLILLDIQLPDISGLDVITWLKADEDLQSIPVVALTAFAMNGDREMFLERGFDAYISKPISIPDFLKVVSGYLGTNVTHSVEEVIYWPG